MVHEIVEEIKNTIRGEIQEVHTALPAKIELVNADGTVNARPYGVYKLPDGTTMEYPLISQIPVYLFKSGSVSVTLPVTAGDGCLLIICENELDSWLSGQVSGVSLRHNLTSAIAIPGLGIPAASDVQAGGAVIIRNGSAELRVTSGSIAISGNVTISGNLNVTGNINAGGTITPNPADK